MKRKLSGFLVIITTVLFSAFTAKKITLLYYIYKGTGAQNQKDNYFSPLLTSPGIIAGADVLSWIRVAAANQNDATQAEFSDKFDQLNITNTGANSLDDEIENHIDLELRAD